MDANMVFNGRCEIPAKTLHYFSNGTGRDSYIATNSGGLISGPKQRLPLEVANSPTGTSSMFPGIREWRERCPRIESKNIFYHSDGSGRDSYILYPPACAHS